MTTPDDLAALRARMVEGAPDPTDDAADLAREARKGLRISEGEVIPPTSEVKVRLHGGGVTGHTVPVQHATKLLASLQGTLTAIGRAERRLSPQRVMPSDLGVVDVGDATTLSLSADVAPGSVVFFLNGPAVEGNAAADETLLDQCLRELFVLLDYAASDDSQSLGTLTEEMQRLGARVASQLNHLVSASIDSQIEVDLGWRTPRGKRRRTTLTHRGALALRDAIERNRVTTNPITLYGILRTISDGSDKLRLEGADGTDYRLSVDPDVGATLGAFHMRPVEVAAEVTTTWTINTGRTARSYRFLSARVVDQMTLLNMGEVERENEDS